MLAWHMSMFTSPTPPGASASGPAADARLDALTASLAARLGAACQGWDAAEFQALVARIARTQLRWADRGDGE